MRINAKLDAKATSTNSIDYQYNCPIIVELVIWGPYYATSLHTTIVINRPRVDSYTHTHTHAHAHTRMQAC